MKLHCISYMLLVTIIFNIIATSIGVDVISLDNSKLNLQSSSSQTSGISQRGNNGIHSLYNPQPKAAAAASNIMYHFSSRYGGYVMNGLTNVYIVYHGTWTPAQMNIINGFVSTLGSSAWFAVTKTYYYQATDTSAKAYIAGPVVLKGTYTYSAPSGSRITGTTIPNAFSTWVTNKNIPNDPNGIYLWLSSADISESNTVIGGSFMTDYCGYHYTFSAGNVNYVYGFIGNPGRNLGKGCDPSKYNSVTSPNGDRGIDAMLSTIAHEIVEAMSNPFSNAWGDASGNENADKCAWDFGTVYRLSNGAGYNVYFGGKYYLLQRNWNAALQTCAISA